MDTLSDPSVRQADEHKGLTLSTATVFDLPQLANHQPLRYLISPGWLTIDHHGAEPPLCDVLVVGC